MIESLLSHDRMRGGARLRARTSSSHLELQCSQPDILQGQRIMGLLSSGLTLQDLEGSMPSSGDLLLQDACSFVTLLGYSGPVLRGPSTASHDRWSCLAFL